MNKNLLSIYMNKVILYVVAFASLCLMMVGCSDETFNQESGNGTGYLRLALGSVNVELSSISRADAGSLLILWLILK